MCHKKKDFPNYDDVQHIDSAAVSRQAPGAAHKTPFTDPDATAYTEMYCAPTHAIDPQPDPRKS